MARTPLVMDVDTGTDDAIAILCALMSRAQLDLRAFTTVAGNVTVDRTSRNTLDIVEYVGADVPVAAGADRPLRKPLHRAVSHGTSGLGDVILPRAGRAFHPKDAADTLYDAAVAAQGALHVVAVGPLTNLAVAFERHPDLRERIARITVMGGSLSGGNVTAAAEFNSFVDPDAARIVFEAGIPLIMVGLDVTLQTRLPQSVSDAVEGLRGRFADVAARIFSFMMRRTREYGFDPPNVHDALALASVVLPGVITTRRRCVTVVTDGERRGETAVVPDGAPNVEVAESVDLDRFWRWMVDLFDAHQG